ncbi:MAG TPA: glutathione S-transferase family protein [Azospirillaceae bacterium]|nr:glutathione S-transferase family protein [Azospirillaceae bacterium]
MKLYDDPIAPTPRRVRMFLAEKGVEIPRVTVVMGKGEHKSEDYRRISPNSRIPALELDDGTVILESVAICRYIEALHPEPPLMGVGALDQALVEMWQRRMEWELLLPMGMCFRHSHPKMAPFENQVPEYAATLKPVAEKRLAQLDGELSDRPFIAGGRFTIADITAYTTIDFFSRLVGLPIDGLPNVKRWHVDVASRPSAKA